MIKISASHVDHGLTEAQLAHILERFAVRRAFFIETFELPEALGKAPCLLYGPMMGDPPTSAAFEMQRGDRTWWTPVIEAPARMTRMVTVIAGPHDQGYEGTVEYRASRIIPCVLYTAYAGPCAPQEPDDPGCKNVPESRRFWNEHALAMDTARMIDATGKVIPFKLRERGEGA